MARFFSKRPGAAAGTVCALAAFMFTTAQAQAPGAPPINSGDTAWLLISTALVMLMTPGLAFFYGGLVRSKNVLGTMMQSLCALALVSVLWAVVGYSIAFAPGNNFFGNLSYLFLSGVGLESFKLAPDAAWNPFPHITFMGYQMMFAVITPALIGGAIAERMKFKSFMIFMAVWLLVVYAPLAHWVWHPDGWLFKKGALDFAGGTVVHISSGVSALVACLMLGRRQEFPREPILPHNLPFVVLGGGLLWFGWFGFNAGSALAANGLGGSALVATHFSAAAGALTWMMYDWLRHGKPTALGTVSGAVAGLVGITPAAGFVQPMPAIAIGVLTALACAMFVNWRTRRGIDDSLDAYGVHGVGGTVGALLTGLFATAKVNSAVTVQGVLTGGGLALLGTQFIGVIATYAYAGILTFIILKVLDGVIGLRVTEEDERLGLDQSQHGEAGYSL
jgi:Amt family ammonium transporter